MATAHTQPQPKKPDGPWLLLKWLIPLFAVVFVINGIMVYKAQTTFNGLTTEHAYEQGLAYNATLQERAKESQLGWHFTSHLEGKHFTLTAFDAANTALAGATISGQFVRPTNAGEDATLSFAETKPGVYVADLSKLPLGQWELTATATRPNLTTGTTDTFTLTDRVVLQ